MRGPALSQRDRAVLHALGHRIDPSDPGAQNNLGVLYHAREMHAEAIAAFMRALELDPRMVLARRNLEQVRRESGYYDRQIAELGERVARDPAQPETRLELGRAWLALSEPDRATAEFLALRELLPTDSGPCIQLGLAAQAAGRHEQAADWFRQAVEAEPASGVARVYLGVAFY
jgi:tetratricopeptide (TPR) repeat protein